MKNISFYSLDYNVEFLEVTLTLLLACSALFCACSNAQKENNSNINPKNKTMVVYFSATGTTAKVAEQIAQALNTEALEIAPQPAYTKEDLDWTNKESRSSVEMNDSTCRPAIGAIDIHDADTIYLGYPIWWNLAPRQVYTFLESIKLEGKTIIPFATSGSSPIENSAKVLKETYPAANWKEGRLLNNATDEDIKAFVK